MASSSECCGGRSVPPIAPPAELGPSMNSATRDGQDNRCDDKICCAEDTAANDGLTETVSETTRAGCCADCTDDDDNTKDAVCSSGPAVAAPPPSWQGDCYGDSEGNGTTDDCCQVPRGSNVETGKQVCQDSCCSASLGTTGRVTAAPTQPKQGRNSCEDGCCGAPSSRSHVVPDKSQQVGPEAKCCPTPDPSTAKCEDGDSGCDKKPRPCNGCDVSCLDRVALRACEQEKEAVKFDDTSTTGAVSLSDAQCRGGQDGKPCDRHVRVTRDTYASTMEALGCICRALLALGQESCCVKKERSSLERRHSPARSSSSLVSRSSADSCCASSSASIAHNRAFHHEARFRHKHGLRTADPKPQRGSGYCEKDSPKPRRLGVDGASCCGDSTSSSPITKSADISTVTRTVDLERGLSDSEHVVLSITGMTCSGCETKLSRILGNLDPVKNLKTSLVLSRAEFDLDMRSVSVQDVIKHLERTTEFKCERITNQGSSIDIMAPVIPSEFVKQQWPDGVTDMTALDKTTVRITYDPEVVGARALIENGWSHDVQLAALRGDPGLAAGNKHVRHVGFCTLISIILTIPVLVMAWAPLPEHKLGYGSASLALATIVQFAIAGPFYPQALKSLIFSRVIEMDLLIVLSTSAAYIFSVVSFGYLVAGQPLSTGEFFETSTLLVTLIMVGRYAAALARQKAVESISIRSLQVSTAVVVNKSRGEEREIDVRLLQYGDIFKVAPDSRIPTDGTVISGSSEVDESMITGESKSVEKYHRSRVIAGTVNGSGTMLVRLSRLPGDNTINTIASMVDEAKLTKPKIQEMADKVASYFVPVVVVLAAITFAIWIAVGIEVQHKSGTDATIQAITFAITVLIVSCPCAIGLAVPMVVVIASGVAAERGVVFKSSNSIEVAHKTSHVVFDKTGTLTEGKLAIITDEYLSEDPGTSASLLLGLVAGIKHPVSIAVANHLGERGTPAATVSNAKILTGKGVEGTASGLVLRAGNSRWLGLSSDPRVEPILAQGHTAFCFTINECLAAVFGLDDSLRPDAALTVSKLEARGISVHIISGDDDGAVRSVAAQLGLSDSNVRSRCAPSDKQAYIQDLIASSSIRRKTFHLRTRTKEPVVMFCGDGTNDAVALAQATIGVHMNEGTDVAKSAADVVLMRPNLEGLLDIIDMSKRAVNRIKFNFGWSFVYNIFAILLAAGAFVRVKIPPEFAGLGELVSVLPVIAAAVLLRWSRF